MKSLLHLFLALSLISFISAYPSSDPCKWTDPNTGDKYDFSGLHREDDWKLGDLATATEGNLFSIDFVFNFCKPASKACNGKSNLAVFEALEVMGQITDACQIMGSMDQMDVTTGTTLGAPGVKIVFKGGETCSLSENPHQTQQPMYATFNVLCGEASKNQFTQLNYNGDSITKCSPEFYIYHPAGCVGGVFKSGNGFSFLQWMLLIAIVYIVAGTIYNMQVQNQKGLDAIPHIAFWKSAGSNLKGVSVTMKDTAENLVKKLKKGQNSSFMTGGLVGTNQKLAGNTGSAKYTLV